jgi:hypothetical protein
VQGAGDATFTGGTKHLVHSKFQLASIKSTCRRMHVKMRSESNMHVKEKSHHTHSLPILTLESHFAPWSPVEDLQIDNGYINDFFSGTSAEQTRGGSRMMRALGSGI